MTCDLSRDVYHPELAGLLATLDGVLARLHGLWVAVAQLCEPVPLRTPFVGVWYVLRHITCVLLDGFVLEPLALSGMVVCAGGALFGCE